MSQQEIDLLKFCKDIFKFPRSISGQGVRDTLKYIKDYIPIEIKKIDSGEKVFDWEIPPEWNINSAYVHDISNDKRVIDFNDNTLHVLGYSTSVNKEMGFEELESHLYYLEDLPEAIPYKTSYYEERWGFCLSYNKFKSIDRNSRFKVVIDSSHDQEGVLNYGELIIKGKSSKEIFISTYICHPQMANNELSGPSVATGLAASIINENNYYTYRFVFVPETIGSIAYLSRNFKTLKKNVIGGFNITCVGDEKSWGYIPSRYGDNISDKISKHVLNHYVDEYNKFSWLDRGSDERQYCAPGIDLPICCITRTKWNEYPEYHTSLDNFDFVTAKGLSDSFRIFKKCFQVFELNLDIKPITNILCEPNLGKRGLHPKMKIDENDLSYRNIKHFISYCDGSNTILDIANLCGFNFFDTYGYYLKAKQNKII